MAGESEVLGVWDCSIKLAMIWKCVGILSRDTAIAMLASVLTPRQGSLLSSKIEFSIKPDLRDLSFS